MIHKVFEAEVSGQLPGLGSEVHKDLKVDAGDRVEFVWIAPGRYELMAATQEVTELKGMFGPAKKTVSIQAMNAAFTGCRAAAR